MLDAAVFAPIGGEAADDDDVAARRPASAAAAAAERSYDAVGERWRLPLVVFPSFGDMLRRAISLSTASEMNVLIAAAGGEDDESDIKAFLLC